MYILIFCWNNWNGSSKNIGTSKKTCLGLHLNFWLDKTVTYTRDPQLPVHRPILVCGSLGTGALKWQGIRWSSICASGGHPCETIPSPLHYHCWSAETENLGNIDLYHLKISYSPLPFKDIFLKDHFFVTEENTEKVIFCEQLAEAFVLKLLGERNMHNTSYETAICRMPRMQLLYM